MGLLPMYEQRLDEIVRETCCNCGVVFGVTKFLQDMKIRDKACFYCPNGHGQSYTTNEADRLRKQLEAANAEIERANRAKQVALDTARMEAEQRRKAETKLDRINNGVCPKCKRSFVNMARHMQSKHGVKCNQPPKGSKVRG